MRLNFTSGHKDSFYFFIRGILAHTINFRVCVISLRVRPRFFDQVGHETIYASSGNLAMKSYISLINNCSIN